MRRLGLVCLVAAAFAACGDDGEAPLGAATATASSAASATASGGGGGGEGGAGTGGGPTGAGGDVPLPATFEVSGIVTDGEAPLAGAYVLQGGDEVQMVTGADGAFRITMRGDRPGYATVVAGKAGHRTAGQEIYELPVPPIELVVRAAEPPDNVAYVYGQPGIGDTDHDISTDFCGHCHTTFAAAFQGSAHARATRDPWVQDLYAGVAEARDTPGACDEVGGLRRDGAVPGAPGTTSPRCYVGDGVLPDLNGCGGPLESACDDPSALDPPTAFGACADCHAAGLDGPAGGRDLLEAEGVSFDSGNHCDACHHVADIDLDAPPGTAGRLVLQRPRERVTQGPPVRLRQVMYGPLLDVPNPFMGGSLQPKFAEADFCAGCHEQLQPALVPGDEIDPVRWPGGLPTHSTFSEWQASDYAAAGTPCQGCHMPPVPGMFNSVDVAEPSSAGIAAGFARSPERNRSHAFLGALDGAPRMIERAVALSLETDISRDVSGATLALDVSIVNYGAGHAVPTGEPMRSLLLTVEVDACGDAAAPIAGGSIGLGAGALATTTVGDAVPPGASATLAWAAAAAVATPGDEVRVMRPTNEPLDYPGVGSFASLSPEEKGKWIEVPVGSAIVLDVEDGGVTLDRPLSVLDGDVLVLGHGVSADPDGEPIRALAGLPGRDFQRILRDAAGRAPVPHHRATHVVSDDRIPPSGRVVSSHGFALPDGCDEVSVRATLLYRRAPFSLAQERGWGVVEHVAARAEATIAVAR